MSQRDRESSRPEESEIKVTDRRLFTSDGQIRPEMDQAEEEVAVPAAAEASEPAPEAPAESGFERHPVEEPQGVDFTMLINAMAEPALLFLGEIPHPGSNESRVDLERARFQIDMLDLLRVKSRGNLTPEEDGLLDRILYQLRMLYVARANQPGK